MTIQTNPLLEPLSKMLSCLRTYRTTEHQLLSRLVDQQMVSADYGRDSLSLFRVHFLLMNALYQLQPELAADKIRLVITAVSIELVDVAGESVQEGAVESVDAGLRDYYLDWQQLEDATGESVDQLLDSFWRRYLAADDRQDALSCMGLSEPVTYSEIRQAYRRKSMQLHPDRGGDHQALTELNGAMEVLKRYYR